MPSKILFNEEDKSTIIYEYSVNKSSLHKVAGMFGTYASVILSNLRAWKIPTRNLSESKQVYELTHNIFEEIDSSEKAYWVGFLAADGCVTESNRVSIGLAQKDAERVESFKKFVGSTHPLIITAKNKKHFGVRWSARSDKMVSDLSKYGIVSNKTFTITFGEGIPEKYLSSYLLGFFDGDGCIFINKNRYPRIVFVGSYAAMDQLNNHVANALNVSPKKIVKINRGSSVGQLTYSRTNEVKALIKYMYADCRTFMLRKKELSDLALTLEVR